MAASQLHLHAVLDLLDLDLKPESAKLWHTHGSCMLGLSMPARILNYIAMSDPASNASSARLHRRQLLHLSNQLVHPAQIA